MLAPIAQVDRVRSEVTGRDELSTIRKGIADADLYAMFGCIEMDDAGRMSLKRDENGNVKGDHETGDRLESMLKRKGGRVSKFRQVEDAAAREARIQMMELRFLNHLAEGVDVNAEQPENLTIFAD